MCDFDIIHWEALKEHTDNKSKRQRGTKAVRPSAQLKSSMWKYFNKANIDF